MTDLLSTLEEKWREVSQYDDIEAVRWTPGDPVEVACPTGCEPVDTGWQPMESEEGGPAAYRRSVFCRDHGFARIYVIDAREARRHGWEPPAHD